MDYSKYENKLEWPQKPSKPSRPKDPGIDGTSKDFSEYVEKLKVYETELKAYETGPLVEYEKAKKDYREESARLLELFKHDLLEVFGFLGDPKEEKAWEIAHQEGEGNYSLMYITMQMLADFYFS